MRQVPNFTIEIVGPRGVWYAVEMGVSLTQQVSIRGGLIWTLFPFLFRDGLAVEEQLVTTIS